MATWILATIGRGRSIAWLDHYSGKGEALTVDEISAAIHSRVCPTNLALVTAATFAEK